MSLIQDDIRIACEVSVTNTPQYEMKNIQKCLDANYSIVCIISKSEEHLKTIRIEAQKTFNNPTLQHIYFFNPDVLPTFLETATQNETKPTHRVKGCRVNVHYDGVVDTKDEINNIILNTERNKRNE